MDLIAPEDRAWLHALCAPRFLPRMERALEQRGHAETVRGLLDDLLALIGERPRERVVGTWRAGGERPVETAWFGAEPSPEALEAEVADVARFLNS